MAITYYTKLTIYGAAQIAAATAGAPINLVAMAIGDGGGSETTPSELQTQLVSETYRATLNRLVVDAKAATKLIAELIIPESAGGWTMREVGIYDDKGQLFAVANTPPSYKPQTSEGSAKTQVVRIVIKVSSTANVTIFNDPSTVIATVEHVTDQFAARNVSAGTGLDGGGSLSGDVELSVKYGTTAGTAAQGNDSRLSNAREWIADLVEPVEADAGTAKIARKWTAELVRICSLRAVSDFINIITTPFSRTMFSWVSAAAARAGLELGNAATHNYGSSANTIAQGNDHRFSMMLGVGQTWQDVSAQRSVGTIYTNTTGRTICVMWATGGNNRDIFIDGFALNTWNETGAMLAVIPNGSTYRCENNFLGWYELRQL